MPTYTLHGVDVDFPHEAYACQIEYMSRVVAALQSRQHALLESPTGTGKTLCLLCATLGWRAWLVKSRGAAGAAAAAHAAAAAAGLPPGAAAKAAAAAAQAPAPPGAPPPDFSLPQVVYASRTHSQLRQVVHELRATSYAASVRTTVLSSRQQMCLNPRVSRIASTAAANLSCRAHVAHKQCEWHSKERIQAAAAELQAVAAGGGGGGAVRQAGQGAAAAAASAAAAATGGGGCGGGGLEPPDIEDLVQVGKIRRLCPYFLSR